MLKRVLGQNSAHEDACPLRSTQEEPMSDAVNARTDIVEMPPGAPSGFPVAQVFREEGSEFYAGVARESEQKHTLEHLP